MLTTLGKLSGFKFWSTVTVKHVDSNSLPKKKSVLDNILSDSVDWVILIRVVYFLGAGHKQIVILLSPTVARLFAFNLTCVQFTVPVDAITISLKTTLLCRQNGAFGQRLFNVCSTSVQRSRHCLKTRKRLPLFLRSTIPKQARFCDGYCMYVKICMPISSCYLYFDT